MDHPIDRNRAIPRRKKSGCPIGDGEVATVAPILVAFGSHEVVVRSGLSAVGPRQGRTSTTS